MAKTVFRCKVVLYPFELNMPAFDAFEMLMPGGSITFTTHPTDELSQAFLRVSATIDELTAAYSDEQFILTFAQLNPYYAGLFDTGSEFMTKEMIEDGEFEPIENRSIIASYWFACSSALNFDAEAMSCKPPHIDDMAGCITIEAITDSTDNIPVFH